MDEIYKLWLEDMYRREIADARAGIQNEHLWELGYDGEEPNPHPENIENLMRYIEILEEHIGEL